jgi:hypothetical protein
VSYSSSVRRREFGGSHAARDPPAEPEPGLQSRVHQLEQQLAKLQETNAEQQGALQRMAAIGEQTGKLLQATTGGTTIPAIQARAQGAITSGARNKR